MVSALERETAPEDQSRFFHTGQLKDIYAGLQTGKPEAQDQLLDLVARHTHNPDFKLDSIALGSQLSIAYGLDEISAVGLLDMVDPQIAIPAISNLLQKGSEGRALQVMVDAAAHVISKINSPQTLELIPLINQNLANLGRRSDELMDEDAGDEFELNRSTVMKSLGEARTSALWNSAGKVRDRLGVILPFTGRGQSFLVLRADPETKRIICFDLEGPLSGQDNAYEVFKLIPDGEQMFRAISYYDDMVCGLVPGKREWRRENYEAGDTLKLIIPHFVHHGVKEDDIRQVSTKATLVPGVKELFNELEAEGWRRNIVSTSYSQHAYNIGAQIGLTPNDIYCTQMPLDRMKGAYSGEAGALLNEFEHRLKGFSPDDFGTAKDEELKAVLDKFYWEDLPRTKLGEATRSVAVMGGARKAWAVERVARDANAFFEQMAFVGDSITDSQAAKVIEATRGLMTAFNGNDFVIPFATIGFATTNMNHLKPALDVWQGNGRAGLRDWINNQPEPTGEFDTRYNWITDATDEQVRQIVDTHRRFRRKLRDDAAALG